MLHLKDFFIPLIAKMIKVCQCLNFQKLLDPAIYLSQIENNIPQKREHQFYREGRKGCRVNYLLASAKPVNTIIQPTQMGVNHFPINSYLLP